MEKRRWVENLFDKLWDRHWYREWKDKLSCMINTTSTRWRVRSTRITDVGRKSHLTWFNLWKPLITMFQRSIFFDIRDVIFKAQIDTSWEWWTWDWSCCPWFLLRRIVHMVGPETGRTQPGKFIVCGDSHTATTELSGAIAFFGIERVTSCHQTTGTNQRKC